MARYTTRQSIRSTSFVLGLLLATSTVLLGHCVMYFLVAAAFHNFVLEPLFSATFFSGVFFVVLAGVLYARTVASRRKQGLTLEVSVGQSVGWNFGLVLVLSVLFSFIYSATEVGGFGMPVVLFSLLHGFPSGLLAIATSVIGIRLHCNKFHLESAPAQPN